MEIADIFTYRQNDLQSTSFAALEEMRRKGQFCDLTIKVQNHLITAHRNIVAAGIPYFRSVFDCTEVDKEKEIAVRDSIDPRALESLILFAYTGKIDITAENAQSLLVTSQFMKLDQIYEVCIEFLSKRLNIQNVMQVRELASNLNSSRLIDSCDDYIRKNFEALWKTREFLNLAYSDIKEILSKDDLVIKSEEVAFEAMMEWVRFSPSERHVALPELLSEVRMIYLPLPYVMKQIDTEELITNSKLCRDMVNEVKYYHLLPEMSDQFANLKTWPRHCYMQNLYAVCSDNSADSERLLVFTLINDKWITLSSADLLGYLHSVVAVEAKIYMFLDETVLILDLVNHKWEQLKLSYEGIDGSAATLHEGKVYFVGSEENDFESKMCFFDSQSNTFSETKEMKTARWDSAAASLGEFIYITGGFSVSNQINSVEKYCPSRDEWTDVAPMLVERDGHGCATMNGIVYVCGGMNSRDVTLGVAEMYDPVTNQWTYLSKMESGKCVVSLVPYHNKIYAFGKTDVEEYETVHDEWKSFLFVPNRFLGAVSISAFSNQNDPD